MADIAYIILHMPPAMLDIFELSLSVPPSRPSATTLSIYIISGFFTCAAAIEMLKVAARRHAGIRQAAVLTPHDFRRCPSRQAATARCHYT